MTSIFIIFLLCAGIQILFHLLFVIQMMRYKMKQHVLDIEDKPVSIVICSHNSIDRLKTLLEKLYIQAYRDFEIIVVDDRSDDGTYEFMIDEKKKKEIVKFVRIDWTPEHINEKKYALTLGIKAAGNDLLLFTDADCEPKSIYWIQQMINQFDQQTDFVLGFSYYRKYKGFLNLFIRHETLQTALLYINSAIAGMPYMGVGRNLAYRKSFFLSHNGFKHILKVVGGDDDLFVNRYANGKNTAVAVHEDTVILSEPKKSLQQYVTQKIRHLSAGKKYKLIHKVVLAIFSFSKFGFWIALLSLIILKYQLYLTGGVFLLSMLLTLWSFNLVSKKFGVKYEYGWVWIMDFVYISYLTLFSLAAFLSKRIKWS